MSPAHNSADEDPPGSAELERELARIRTDMDRTIGQIEHRLSPDRLIDQALVHLRGGPGAIAAKLGRAVTRHPVPTALAAAALGWLLLAERGDASRSPSQRESRRPAAQPYHLREMPEVSGAQPQGGTTMSERWEHSRRGDPTLHGRSSGPGDVGGGRIGRVGSAARQQVDRARTGFEHMLEEQPLVLGAVAVALGAVLGATLPTSRIEDRYFGPTRERLRHQAGDYAREQWERARDVALSAGSAAKSQAEEQGITPAALYEGAKEKVTRVAEAAGEAAQEEARRRSHGGGGPRRS